jgi:hypothetical protein
MQRRDRLVPGILFPGVEGGVKATGTLTEQLASIKIKVSNKWSHTFALP